MTSVRPRRAPLTNGDELIKRWQLPVRQARFHRGGRFFMPPTRFPLALCDPDGYVSFPTEEAYKTNPKLSNDGPRLNVRGGISSLPGYTRVRDPVR